MSNRNGKNKNKKQVELLYEKSKDVEGGLKFLTSKYDMTL